MTDSGTIDHVTAEDLDAALPHVLAAPHMGPVSLLCTRPAHNKRVFPDRIRLTAAGGIEGDLEMTSPWLRLPDGTCDPRIQVSILSRRVLDLVWRDRERQAYPGDTIIADLDLSEANLPAGTLIRAGTAVLRVSGLWNEGCAKWKVRMGRPAQAWVSAPAHAAYRLRGALCSIEKDGEVALGDMVGPL